MLGSQLIDRTAAPLGLFLALIVAACSGSDGGAGADLVGATPEAILSDDFHTGVLDTVLWNVVDPQGDGTVELVGAGTPDAQLLLSVPQGTVHDPWTSNTALRAMQPAADEDFQIEVKFESEPAQRYQGQGLLVEQDTSNYVRFDVFSDGNSLRVFSATFTNGSPSVRTNQSIASGPTTYLRLSRSGNQWTTWYSYDGSSWVTAVSFTHPLAVSSVGVFAGNFNPNPAYTAVVDYFFETSAPIASEDPLLCDPSDSLVLTTQATNGTILRNPDLSSYNCGDVVTLTAQPDVGATFVGWSGALSGTSNPATLTIDADTTVTANFTLDASPPQVSNVNVTASYTSAALSWQTDELSIGFIEHGLTPSYELGSIASSTLSTAHSATLPGLSEGQVYHYRVTAEDSFGNSATSADATFTTATSVCSLVLTTQATNGTILLNPDLSSYNCGDVVTLTAQPDVGATFVGWSGALSGTSNPATLTIDADTTVTANFTLDASPPQVSNVNVTASYTSAALSWQTDELSIGFIEHGLTPSYELGSIASSTLSTAHSATLPGLSEGQVYHYRVTAEDSFGNSATSADATFTTATSGGGTGGGGGGGGATPGAILSDDFHTGVLDTVLWNVVDPQGDGTVELVGAGTPDAQLLLSVPQGTVHDPWTSNTALRAMQPAADEDFQIEVKFESEPAQRYQGQGLLVEQDTSNYVRFDVFSDGNSLRVFSATFTNGSPSVRTNQSIASGPTTYLRLSRSGNQWTTWYSYDGSSWVTAVSFTHPLAVSSVGVFAGNFNPNPAYTAVVDYFFETSAPIASEDPLLCDPSDSLVLTTQATNGTILRNPDLSSYNCGDVVTLTAQPDVGATFVGWSGALSGTSNPATLTIDADTTVTATFTASTAGPTIDVWYGDSQSFGALGEPQRWVNVLGQVSDPDGVSVLTYSLNGNPPRGLSFTPFRRLSQPGDFNVELDYQQLLLGMNTIEIRAVNGIGSETIKTVSVDYAPGNVWPLPYRADWSSAANVSDVAQVVDGRWSIVNGELRNDVYGYDRLVTLGDISWTDYEVTVPVTVHSISPDPVAFQPPNSAPGVGVMLRWTGHFDWTGEQPTWGFYPMGGGGWLAFFDHDGNGKLRIDDFTPSGVDVSEGMHPWDLGVTYMWKVRVQTQSDGTSIYRLKVWPLGAAEPPGWRLVAVDGVDDVQEGSLVLISHFTDVSFGDVTIDPL